MKKFTDLDINSVNLTLDLIEKLRKRRYFPLSLNFKLHPNKQVVDFIKTQDWEKAKEELNRFVKYPQFRGQTIVLIQSLRLRVANLDKYGVIFYVNFIGDLDNDLIIIDEVNVNNFKQDVIDREVERYKQFIQTLVDDYKRDINRFDNLTGKNEETDKEAVYYVDNEPEYMENQLDYTKKEN